MYEQVSHATLNQILDELKPEIKNQELRFFYSRLGANFYAIYQLFEQLYGNRSDFYFQLKSLVEVMAKNYIDRPDSLKIKDREKEADHSWFLKQEWVGMALYANGFSDNLADMASRIDYFSELGVNLVHILPILECPAGKSDGGYAVSDFRKVDSRLGSNSDLDDIVKLLHERNSLLALDIVVNHTSDEHEWVQKAKAGDAVYQDYFYTFDSRVIPDMFEMTMPEVFPESDPGNFTFDKDMNKWVMTVFHQYQWDLNYTNPQVFIQMLDIMFFWANKGVDILRLDAVAFLWKKIGTPSQNEREAHLILQLFKDCSQVVAPGLLFIAEAIVAPTEIIKYFGDDAVAGKECDIAYNATLMALLWDAVATKNTRLLRQGIQSLPHKLERATWLNYLRCHDDIGFGFEDADISQVGYQPHAHRKFLIDYFTGEFDGSDSKGATFGKNEKTGDARISGTLASLSGLESALDIGDNDNLRLNCQKIILLNSVIMSFGGIPLLYYGDEVGTLNDYSYLNDDAKAKDSRWLHRPKIQWNVMDRRHDETTVEFTLFENIKRLIALRKTIDVFSDFNNRELIHVENSHLFAYERFGIENCLDKVYVVANFSDHIQRVPVGEIFHGLDIGAFTVTDLWTRQAPDQYDGNLILSPFQFYWLTID